MMFNCYIFFYSTVCFELIKKLINCRSTVLFNNACIKNKIQPKYTKQNKMLNNNNKSAIVNADCIIKIITTIIIIIIIIIGVIIITLAGTFIVNGILN